MANEKEINKNKRIFQQTNEKYHVFTNKLIEFLGESYYTAPASTMLSLHNAYEGGLLDHSIRVAKFASMLNELLPEKLKCSKESVIKVSFLSEIGKVFLYKKCESDWHIKNQGKIYEFADNVTSMRIGERSVYYALSNEVILTEEETQAILNFEKPDDDHMAKWHSSPLSKILKTAIEFAIMEEKTESVDA